MLVALKGIIPLKYLSKYVDRNVLNLYYKLYMHPHLDYGDVIYHDQRADLMQLIEQVQYKAELIVSGCWQGTSCERFYDELGWESPSDRRWARRMTTFYKVKYELANSYLSDHLPEQSVNITTPFSRIEMYGNSFFPYCIENWNKLGNSSQSCFKKHLNSFTRPKGKSFYGINANSGIIQNQSSVL